MTGGVSDGEKIRNHYGAVPRNHRGIGSSAGLAEFSDHGLSQFPPALDEQVLLFAQRPDATAVLPIDGKNGWNQRFGRWVNRGATGIAVFDGDAVGRSRLKYYLIFRIPMKADSHGLCRSGPCARNMSLL